ADRPGRDPQRRRRAPEERPRRPPDDGRSHGAPPDPDDRLDARNPRPRDRVPTHRLPPHPRQQLTDSDSKSDEDGAPNAERSQRAPASAVASAASGQTP